MRTCPTCGKTILFGGIHKDDKLYCCKACYREDPANQTDGFVPAPKDGRADRFAFVAFLLYFAAMGLWIVYNNLIERLPEYDGPIIPKFIIIGIAVIIGIIAFLIFGYYWISGYLSHDFSKWDIRFATRLNLRKPIKRLRFRSGIYLTRYRYKGRKVALFDHGGCNLCIVDDKEYSFSCWGSYTLKAPLVLESGSSELAYIIDHHRTIVETEEESTAAFYGFDGTTVYTKCGESEVVAHSETPLHRRAERVIACGGKQYLARYRKYGKIELKDFRTGRSVGRIREFLFWGCATFYPPLPLLEGILINLLVTLDGEQCHPYRDAGSH